VAATRTVRSVDGRTWTIDAGRFRPPRWRESVLVEMSESPGFANRPT
jgi:hypothetical protein